MQRDPFALFTLAAVLWLGALPTPSGAQGDAVFAERVEVELVLVDVFAHDRDGAPITNLTAEDFRLFQDGRPVPISQFTAARSAGQGTAGGAAPPGRSGADAAAPIPRRLVIFLDNLHLHPNSRARLMRTLEAKLATHLEPTDEVMVVGFGGTTEVLLEMTRDREALRRVLREQARSRAISLLAFNDDQRILEIIERRHAEENLSSGFFLGDPCVDLGFIAESHVQQVHGRVMTTIAELNRFVNSLAGYEGRKVLLHVSDGIPLVPGAEAYRFASELCDGTGVSKGLDNALDTELLGNAKYTRWDPTKTASTLQEFNTADEWTRLAGHANTYQVSFYMFQAHMPTNRSASVDSARTSFDTEMEGKRNKQDPLFLLADETGGRALLDSNDVERALVQMTEDWSAGYQLAFEPLTPGDGRRHNLRVEVARPGLTLRYRKSYMSKRIDERIADRVVSTLIHGEASNPLDVRLEIGDRIPVERGLTNVTMRVLVPLGRLVLLPEEGLQRGLFTVFVAIRSERGQLTPVGQKTVPLRVPLAGGQTEFVYSVEVPLWGDRGQVAVAVQDQLGGEVSYVREQLLASESR